MAESSTTCQINSEALDALVEDVRDFIDRIQHPPVKDYDWSERMRQAGEDLANKLVAFASSASEKQASIYTSMKALADRLRAYAGELAENPNCQALVDRRDMLSRSYEEFIIELKKRRVARAAALAQSRQLKPINYARNLFHVITGLTGFFSYYFFLNREQALGILITIFAIFGTLEVTRRFSVRWNDFLVDKVFGAISRPSERYRVNSATVYVLALIIIVWFFPKLPVLAALLVLSFSDPAASLIGKRWGRRKLFRDKSIVGTTTFFVVGTFFVGALLFLAEPSLGLASIFAFSAIIASAGALTELLSSRIDDNFSIPIVCAIIGSFLL